MSKYELRFFKANFFCPEASELIDGFQKNQALIDSPRFFLVLEKP